MFFRNLWPRASAADAEANSSITVVVQVTAAKMTHSACPHIYRRLVPAPPRNPKAVGWREDGVLVISPQRQRIWGRGKPGRTGALAGESLAHAPLRQERPCNVSTIGVLPARWLRGGKRGREASYPEIRGKTAKPKFCRIDLSSSPA